MDLLNKPSDFRTMLTNRLYYLVKPWIPRSVRMSIRRIPAKRKRKDCAAIWPINERASQQPNNWKGWPERKEFAIVLTHDVEGPGGLEKCRDLAELEMKLGFRSSFNFIPEGNYEVPQELIHWLIENGFEVGVHDLKHDGKLFHSRASFGRLAPRINGHLREWSASGFRSAFMLRNLEWVHDLDIDYDASTFDTDPFEPQPEGAGTIFPFWVSSSATVAGRIRNDRLEGVTARQRGGYVELPYTLPQDSTLFLVLGEKTPAIWLNKLDWIASRGGMALVNVHPDYITFGDRPGRHQYSSALYSDLLQHVVRNHPSRFWNPLAKDLAKWYKSTQRLFQSPVVPSKSPARFSGMRALVLLYSTYPADPRPRRAAEALVQNGMEVEVICLKKAESEPSEELVNGVRVKRLPFQHQRGGKLGYLKQYASFLAATFVLSTWRALRRRYALIHVHNMPDALVFSAAAPKLLGAKVLLDLHDPMPELMRTIFGMDELSLPVRLLKRVEKWSLRFADSVVTVNRACKTIFSKRSCPSEKITVIMNSPDESIFCAKRPVVEDPAPQLPTKPFVIMYHGSIVERHGLDLAVKALSQLRKFIPEAELRIYGTPTVFLHRILDTIRRSDLEQAVRYFGPKNLNEIVAAIGECDVGIVPNRKSIFTELNTPTRIFEYLSQAKPVIAPRAQGILDYFAPDELFYFTLGDADDLAAQLLKVASDKALTTATIAKGQSVYWDHMWSNERNRFIDLVGNALGEERIPQLQSIPEPV